MRKKDVFLLFMVFPCLLFSQKKVHKKVQTNAAKIEISTIGLDDFILENATSPFLEIYLIAEDSNLQHVVFKESKGVVNIEFRIPEMIQKEEVFRKFITERLQRASAIIKIPQSKSVVIFGEEINISSKSYQGPLAIYIEKGLLKLDTIQDNTKVKFYEGSVFGTLKNMNIDVTSTSGTIAVDKKIQQEVFYKKTQKKATNFSVTTTKGNIFLTTLKPQ